MDAQRAFSPASHLQHEGCSGLNRNFLKMYLCLYFKECARFAFILFSIEEKYFFLWINYRCAWCVGLSLFDLWIYPRKFRKRLTLIYSTLRVLFFDSVARRGPCSMGRSKRCYVAISLRRLPSTFGSNGSENVWSTTVPSGWKLMVWSAPRSLHHAVLQNVATDRLALS